MGYTTIFEGHFTINPALNEEQVTYLNQFCNTRRMKRDAKLTEKLIDVYRTKIDLPVGVDGEFYVGGDENSNDILDHNHPPSNQPGLWCDWQPNENGTILEWNESEKFYRYIEWLQYLIEKFFNPWGNILNGKVKFQGETRSDKGTIVIKDNVIIKPKATKGNFYI